jgi:hypothetical protein
VRTPTRSTENSPRDLRTSGEWNTTSARRQVSPLSEHSTPTPPSTGHPNTPEKLDSDLKVYLMMMIEDVKKDFNNSLKEIQENTAKQVEDLKDEAQKSIRVSQENTTKQVMELNQTIQDLKREVDTIKKTQSEATLGIKKPRKEIWNYRCKHQQQNTRDGRESLRCTRFHREHRQNNQRKQKMQKDPNSKHPGNPVHNEKNKPTDNRSR